MRIAIVALAACLSIGATGCASIVSGVNQSIAVQTRLDGQPLAGAACRLSSNKGTWFVTTPGSVTVHRGFQDLEVECTKDGVPTGLAQFASSTKAMAFGNILFGGAIGVGVDVGTGAAYDYPELLSIDMGKSTAYLSDTALAAKPRDKPADAAAAPAAAAVAATASVTPVQMAPVFVSRIQKKPPAVPLGLASGQPDYVAPVRAPAPRAEVAIADGSPLRFRAYAEKLARDRACHPQPIAALSATGPVSETYTIACVAGEPMVARCEADECRELR